MFARVLDLLYPRTCANCARVGQAWCDHCAEEIAGYPFTPLQRTLDSGLQTVFVAEHHGIVRNAIHALKFENARALAEPLGNALASGIKEIGLQADFIVPVPLHTQREKWRGYNQAGLLAESVSYALDIPYANSVTRIRSTGTQVGRDASARHVAVDGAFTAEVARASGFRVLLIDDVVTTGATLSACADALYAAGASSVCAACVVSA